MSKITKKSHSNTRAGQNGRPIKIHKGILATVAMVSAFCAGAVSVEASTLTTQVRIGSCGDQGAGSASCSESTDFGIVTNTETALARAQFGSLGVYALAEQQTFGGGGISSGHPIWSSFASFNDELTLGVQEGIFRVGVNISGSVNLESTGTFRGSNSLNSIAGVRAYVDTQLIYEDIMTMTPSAGQPGGPIDRSTTGTLGTTVVDIPFTDGSLILSASLFAIAKCGGQFEAGTCTAETDFFGSANLMAAVVLDGNGVELPNISISSASGFDYAAGFASVSAVPVPAALPLFGTGLAIMGFVGWRRKRNAA